MSCGPVTIYKFQIFVQFFSMYHAKTDKKINNFREMLFKLTKRLD